MALETAQDLLNFFDTETHGSSATVTINGAASSIRVIINKEYFAIAGESVDVDGTQPVVTCRSSDVTNIDTADSTTTTKLPLGKVGGQINPADNTMSFYEGYKRFAIQKQKTVEYGIIKNNKFVVAGGIKT